MPVILLGFGRCCRLLLIDRRKQIGLGQDASQPALVVDYRQDDRVVAGGEQAGGSFGAGQGGHGGKGDYSRGRGY